VSSLKSDRHFISFGAATSALRAGRSTFRPYSPLMPAALMIGHHFAISAF
jgi:hypothetical protein